MEKVVILGSGVAGLTAAIYAARAELSPLVLTGNEDGGQLTLTTTVENFPGFPEGILGSELVEQLKKQSQKFGARIKVAHAADFHVKDGFVEIVTDEETIQTVTLIIATGASARWLGIPSEKQFMGRGIHTCATCDGFFYKDKTIMVIGGGDSACEESNFLTKFAKKVYVVHRRDELKASKIMQERLFKNPKIEMIWNAEVHEVKGDSSVKSAVLKDTVTGDLKEHTIDGIFLAIGHVPNTAIFEGKINLDKGFIITDRRLHTNVPGVFAAGDVQDFIYKQAVTAAGTGCQAAMEAEKYYSHWKESKE
ncbi:thioredoxin-disulfide reductase [Candidatus Woesearchaeota archaeon]|nr:MAG: thioredoxin-disulfide reductase [Candidatus Woesearchaeota archaeon]